MHESDITRAILERVAQRGAEKSICPSEVARALWPQTWREQMQAVREVAYQLRDSHQIGISQGGVSVPVGERAKGAIRLHCNSQQGAISESR